MSTWKVYHEPADTDEPRHFIGSIEGDTMVQALDNAAQFYELPSHDLVVERELTASEENEQVVACAIDQAPLDMVLTPVEVTHSALYQRIEAQDEGLSVQGVRWYVELELLNLVDGTTAAALYRVWRTETGAMKAVRVELLGGKLRKD